MNPDPISASASRPSGGMKVLKTVGGLALLAAGAGLIWQRLRAQESSSYSAAGVGYDSAVGDNSSYTSAIEWSAATMGDLGYFVDNDIVEDEHGTFYTLADIDDDDADWGFRRVFLRSRNLLAWTLVPTNVPHIDDLSALVGSSTGQDESVLCAVTADDMFAPESTLSVSTDGGETWASVSGLPTPQTMPPGFTAPSVELNLVPGSTRTTAILSTNYSVDPALVAGKDDIPGEIGAIAAAANADGVEVVWVTDENNKPVEQSALESLYNNPETIDRWAEGEDVDLGWVQHRVVLPGSAVGLDDELSGLRTALVAQPNGEWSSAHVPQNTRDIVVAKERYWALVDHDIDVDLDTAVDHDTSGDASEDADHGPFQSVLWSDNNGDTWELASPLPHDCEIVALAAVEDRLVMVGNSAHGPIVITTDDNGARYNTTHLLTPADAEGVMVSDFSFNEQGVALVLKQLGPLAGFDGVFGISDDDEFIEEWAISEDAAAYADADTDIDLDPRGITEEEVGADDLIDLDEDLFTDIDDWPAERSWVAVSGDGQTWNVDAAETIAGADAEIESVSLLRTQVAVTTYNHARDERTLAVGTL